MQTDPTPFQKLLNVYAGKVRENQYRNDSNLPDDSESTKREQDLYARICKYVTNAESFVDVVTQAEREALGRFSNELCNCTCHRHWCRP